MARIAILIDGSNFVASLYRADLGYPALAPLVELLRDQDTLSFARFYGAPPPREPWAGRWKAFLSANRHVRGLDFFQGYRHARTGEEKAIDVALAVDLLYGKLANHFGICMRGAGSPVPLRHAASAGSPTVTPLLRGSSATPSR